jgi:hypothetical protein
MKTIRMSILLASVVGAASLFAAIPVSMSASSSWATGDSVFYTGERELPGTYRFTSPTGTEGQGFDVLNAGEGVKIEDFAPAYVGTSLGLEASDGWDVFRVGEGDPLP